MSDTTGWIKLSRNIVDMKGYFDEKFTRVQCWIDLLLLAEWQPERSFYIRGNRVRVKRGQVAVSLRELSERWGLAINTVQKRLAEFVKDGRIDIQKSNVINLISIINYEKYQSCDTQTDTQNDTQIDTQIDTPNKNNKNNKNIDVEGNARERQKNHELNMSYLARYFDDSKRASLEALLIQLHSQNPETKGMEEFQTLAWQVVCEWEQNEEPPIRDFPEWSKKLIRQIRIKNRIQKESSYAERKFNDEKKRETYAARRGTPADGKKEKNWKATFANTLDR